MTWLSVLDVYLCSTQSCFKLCIINILSCARGISENYTSCFLMLLLVNQCQTRSKIYVIQKQIPELNDDDFHGVIQQKWGRLNIRVTDMLTTFFWPTLSSTIWAENERSQCTVCLLHLMVVNHLWECFIFGARLRRLLLCVEHFAVDYFVLLISTLWSCTISQTWNGKKKKSQGSDWCWVSALTINTTARLRLAGVVGVSPRCLQPKAGFTPHTS